MTYGDVAEYVGTRAPRQVGRVLSFDGGTVPWHRVVRADGSIPMGTSQVELLRQEGVPIRAGRVDLRSARLPPDVA